MTNSFCEILKKKVIVKLSKLLALVRMDYHLENVWRRSVGVNTVGKLWKMY